MQSPAWLFGFRPCTAFTVAKKKERLTSAKVSQPKQRDTRHSSGGSADVYTSYHTAAFAAEEIGNMASLLHTARQHRCYFCHPVGASEAYESSICIRHQLLISLRLLVLLVRRGRFGKLWRVVKWSV